MRNYNVLYKYEDARAAIVKLMMDKLIKSGKKIHPVVQKLLDESGDDTYFKFVVDNPFTCKK